MKHEHDKIVVHVDVDVYEWLIRVARAAIEYLEYTDNITETWNEPSGLSEALKEVEHLL